MSHPPNARRTLFAGVFYLPEQDREPAKRLHPQQLEAERRTPILNKQTLFKLGAKWSTPQVFKPQAL